MQTRRSSRVGPVHFADSPPLPTRSTTTEPNSEDSTSDDDAAATYDQSYLSLHFIHALEVAYTGSPLPTTTIVDTGSPPDVVSDL